MAKRFTDTEKWKDEWFTDLTNDYKVIWQYLLDTCDNAGIFKKNTKILNIMCNTNVSDEDILNTFKGRISVLSSDKWFINKFCTFQYGTDFLNSKNKAVTSAIQKLIENNIIDKTTDTLSIVYPYSIDTLSIPYEYPIDTPKEQEKDKDKFQEEEKVIEKVSYDINSSLVEKILDRILQYENTKLHKEALEDLQEIGGIDYISEILHWDESVKQNYIRAINQHILIHNDK